jgi:hypothetical protein
MKNSRNLLSLFSLIFFSVSIGYGQGLPTDTETKKVSFQETVPIDSVTKNDLYERAVEWMTAYYKTNKFDVNDKVNLKLANEGNFSVIYTYDFKYKSENTITYNITINLKDGKYRYTITDFKIYDVKLGPKTAQTMEVYYPKMKTGSKGEFTTKFNKEVNNVIEDLKKYMITGKGENKEDW